MTNGKEKGKEDKGLVLKASGMVIGFLVMLFAIFLLVDKLG